MGRIAVTVLIDAYNYAKLLEEAIDSVLAQDFPPERMEVIVIDDGSTDGTPQVMEKYDNRVRYYRKANGGQASAFNFGLRRARGEIIALLDADDYWLPGKLRAIVEAIDRNPEAGMVYHAIRQQNDCTGQVTEGGWPLLSGFLPAQGDDLLKYVLYPSSFLAFRRRLLGPLLPIPDVLTIQADAHLSGLMVFLAPVVALREPLAVYRVHGNNLFADASPRDPERQRLRLEARKAWADGMKQWLARHGYNLHRPLLRDLMKQWAVAQEDDEFHLIPPGPLQYSRHLLRYANCNKARMTWRHRAVTYANAAGSLLTGYENAKKLDEWRLAFKRVCRGPWNELPGSRGSGLTNRVRPLNVSDNHARKLP